MGKDLKPCPFCGSENVEYTFSENQGYIVCMDCLANGPFSNWGSDPKCLVQAAVDVWNKRISDEQYRECPNCGWMVGPEEGSNA